VTSTLRTLSLSVLAHVNTDTGRLFLVAFRWGWAEAVALFKTACAARAAEGALAFRFSWSGEKGMSAGVRVVRDGGR